MYPLKELQDLRENNSRQLRQNLHEFSWWLSQVKELKPKVSMEIGTFMGASAEAAVELIPSVELFITIDSRVVQQLLDPRVEQIVADSRLLSTRKKVLEILDGRLLDSLFIDGDHFMQSTCSDFYLYRPLVRDGGLIGFHDIATFRVLDHHSARGCHDFWLFVKSEVPEDTDQVVFEQGTGVLKVKEGSSL